LGAAKLANRYNDNLKFLSTRQSQIPEDSLSVGVCITGQLCRLELRNKNRYFFRAIQDNKYDLFVSLVLLEHFDCHSTNEVVANYRLSTFQRPHDVEVWLSRNRIDGTVFQPKTVTPFYHDRYVYSLDKRGKINETKRALHHYEQWTNLKHCWRELNKVRGHDVYVKLREDSIFVAKFSPFRSLEAYLGEKLISQSKLFVPNCLGWGGINDKAAVAVGSAAFQFFNAPLSVYKQHYNDLKCGAFHEHCSYVFNTYNPESFLQQAIEYMGTDIQGLPAEVFPALTGVSRLGGHMLCFPTGVRQLGQRHGCLPQKMHKLLVGQCLMDSYLITTILTLALWVAFVLRAVWFKGPCCKRTRRRGTVV